MEERTYGLNFALKVFSILLFNISVTLHICPKWEKLFVAIHLKKIMEGKVLTNAWLQQGLGLPQHSLLGYAFVSVFYTYMEDLKI